MSEVRKGGSSTNHQNSCRDERHLKLKLREKDQFCGEKNKIEQ